MRASLPPVSALVARIAAVSLAMVGACSGPASPAAGAPPPTTAAAPETLDEECARTLAHMTQVTGFSADGAGDLAVCRAYTAEQRACLRASMNMPEMALCVLHADPAQRQQARELMPTIVAEWGGTAPADMIFRGAAGCAPFGFDEGASLSPTGAVIVFNVRRTGGNGDPELWTAALARASVGAPWTCHSATPVTCAELAASCATRK